MHFILLDLGFWKFLGFFKIDEVFVKFLGWVLFKWSSMLMHCITFSFSQCFMHFRCVFYMLKWCVLVGLDWAESIMFLMLHVTCSCIFHAYVPLFSIFLILIVFGAFLLVSLSLSFYLVSLRMTPKRKSTPSWNPFRSKASTFDPTPSIWFYDDKACQDFSENFSRHSIHSERQVILSEIGRAHV